MTRHPRYTNVDEQDLAAALRADVDLLSAPLQAELSVWLGERLPGFARGRAALPFQVAYVGPQAPDVALGERRQGPSEAENEV